MLVNPQIESLAAISHERKRRLAILSELLRRRTTLFVLLINNRIALIEGASGRAERSG